MRSLVLLGCVFTIIFHCKYVGIMAVVVWILMGLPWVVEDGGGCACDNDLGFVTVAEKQGGGIYFFYFYNIGGKGRCWIL